MTELALLRNALIEINKLEAPALLLDDYVYFINKAVQLYTEEWYHQYETTQFTTDNLRALKRTAILNVEEDTGETTQSILPNEDSEFYCYLPENYLHMLNCVVRFDAVEGRVRRCPNKQDKGITSPAHKLTADIYPSILGNAYFKPSYKHPYFFINQVNEYGENDPYNRQTERIIDPTSDPGEVTADFTSPRMEIRCGSTAKYKPTIAYVDYIKTPNKIVLTEEDIDGVEDTTKELEFPEDVCYKIIDRFVLLIMENASDPRLQTQPAVNATHAVASAKN